MDKKPKTSSSSNTRSRLTLGGNVKTVTKSKSVDAAGNKTKKRTVERSTLNYGGGPDLSVTKQKIKQKFAGTGATRKVKTLSSKSISELGLPDQSRKVKFSETNTATKEKISNRGLINRGKSWAKSSNRSGRTTTSDLDRKVNYGSAKKNISSVSKMIRKS
jgi:hypothetical protein